MIPKVLIAGLFVTVSLLVLTLQHEAVHEQIYENDGCGWVEVSYGLPPQTKCVFGPPAYMMSEWAQEMHSQNEIVGYYFFAGILILGLFIATQHRER